jgi:hypothetical protein
MFKLNKQSIKLFFSLFLLTTGFFCFSQSAWAATTSVFLSPVKDTNTSGISNPPETQYHTIDWTAEIPTGTSLQVEFRSGDVETPDDTWTAWEVVTNGQDISSHNGNRYFRYRITFGSDNSDTAVVKDIGVVTLSNTSPQGVTSSPYDSVNYENALTGISWQEDAVLPENSSVILSLRTAPDEASLSGASWQEVATSTPASLTSGCVKDSETGEVACDSSVVPANMQDGQDDRWFQYKVGMVSGLYEIPAVYSVEIGYSVMDPQFNGEFGYNGIQVGQVLDSADPEQGSVKIDYSIRDADTTQEVNLPNYVTPSLEYSLNGGSTWSDINSDFISFASAPAGGEVVDANSDGNLDNKVLENEFLNYTVYWRAEEQMKNYSENAKIRVTIDDHEDTDNLAQTQSETFVLDADDSYTNRQYKGTSIFPVKDTNREDGSFGTINWTADIPFKTGMQVEIHAGPTATPDSNWTDWREVENGEDLSFLNGNRYYQYRATFGISDSAEGYPTLQDIAVTYAIASDDLISSPYDTTNLANAIDGVFWKEDPTLPEDSSVILSLRTAPDEASLSGAS